MTFFAAVAVLVLAAATLLAFSGREFLRVNEYPPVRGHRPADVLHLMSLGYSALNRASEEAARQRTARPCG